LNRLVNTTLVVLGKDFTKDSLVNVESPQVYINPDAHSTVTAVDLTRIYT
jgi:hypothetical protein